MEVQRRRAVGCVCRGGKHRGIDRRDSGSVEEDAKHRREAPIMNVKFVRRLSDGEPLGVPAGNGRRSRGEQQRPRSCNVGE